MKMLVESGIERISAYLNDLTDFLCEVVPVGRYEIVSSRHADERSQIVCLRPLNGRSADNIAEDLARDQITVSARGGLLRVAPHFFNNFDDIERFATALP